MTIIQSLITKLEKINNDVLIERLEVLERFVSAEETNRLLEKRQNENSAQIKDIFGEKPPVVSNDDNEEVIGKKDIMDKFKWVMIGIGIFVLLIFVISMIIWYVSSPSVPIEAIEPVASIYNNGVETPTKVDTEYSYFPNIFSNDKINDIDAPVIEKRENERKILEIHEQERLKSQVKERLIESDKFKENSYLPFNFFDKPKEEENSKSYTKDYDRSTSQPKEEEISKSHTKDYDRSLSSIDEEKTDSETSSDEEKTDSETSSDEDKNLDNFKSSKLPLSQNNRDDIYEIYSNKKGLETTIRKSIGGKNKR